jgi:hypothetical protein
MRLNPLTLLVVLAAPSIVFAADFANLGEARKVADKAVALFQQEKIVAGYGSLKSYWPLPGVEIDNLASQTNTQWPMVKGRFGASLSTEFVKECKVGDSVARFVYLQKFQNHAIRWMFTFYKPKDKWLVNTVSFDDNIGALFHADNC